MHYAKLCKIMQYYAKLCNIMQYYAMHYAKLCDALCVLFFLRNENKIL